MITSSAIKLGTCAMTGHYHNICCSVTQNKVYRRANTEMYKSLQEITGEYKRLQDKVGILLLIENLQMMMQQTLHRCQGN